MLYMTKFNDYGKYKKRGERVGAITIAIVGNTDWDTVASERPFEMKANQFFSFSVKKNSLKS